MLSTNEIANYIQTTKELVYFYSEEKKHGNVEYGTALYDFTGTVADELTFEKGDKIEITEIINDEWLRGKHKGQEGMFPRAFVQLSKEESGNGLN